MSDEEDVEETLEWSPDFIMLFNDMMASNVRHRTGEWDDETFIEHYENLLDGVYERIDKFNPNEWDRRTLQEFGFVPWNERILLTPVWLLECIEDGTELTFVNDDGVNELVTVGDDDLNDRLRWGLTPYGVEKPAIEGDD